MAMPERKMTAYDQAAMLIDQLSIDELARIRKKIDSKSLGSEWLDLQEELEQNRIVKALPPLSEEEIYAEFTQYRREQRQKRAQGSC
jgi:hypothetical protein